MLSIEGFAIVSAEGMLAGADGLMPNSLKFDEDQQFLDSALDGAELLVHGRMSHEGQDNSHRRRRLLLTTRCGPFSLEPAEPNVWLWNPRTTPFVEVCEALRISSGKIAILGGTSAYDMFLPVYAKFHLCRADNVSLPGGVPVLSVVGPGAPPDKALREAGLALEEDVTLNRDCGLRRQLWARNG